MKIIVNEIKDGLVHCNLRRPTSVHGFIVDEAESEAATAAAIQQAAADIPELPAQSEQSTIPAETPVERINKLLRQA